ncbi:hypothetical protein CSKR_109755 [Clonorchis sinensis]|uniref:Uncharacterized protein n=1 Tax=Clonorchis sinensis TaxID=79923 RepID=A0A3R7CJQ5_CLOSI|nr:hypothetical protein CSKR_109755 [Clonorchis sinensis]
MPIGNVDFCVVMEGEKDVYNNSFDGVIGLGRRSLCPENTNPVYHFFINKDCSGSSFIRGEKLEQFLSNRVTYINVVDGNRGLTGKYAKLHLIKLRCLNSSLQNPTVFCFSV